MVIKSQTTISIDNRVDTMLQRNGLSGGAGHAVEARHGDVDRYLAEVIGVDAAAVEALRRDYLVQD